MLELILPAGIGVPAALLVAVLIGIVPAEDDVSLQVPAVLRLHMEELVFVGPLVERNLRWLRGFLT